MKSINVSYDKQTDTITPIPTARQEDWVDVCERFDDDVRRVKSLEGRDDYTALYLCFDSDNAPFYYLVREETRLKHMRHKVFFRKLGLDKE